MTRRSAAVVIGAGPAGLATSRLLTDLAVDHVVLERGRVAERWRSERWDSLRLLTPNWHVRLPGHPYRGDSPDGFMSAAELATYLGDYARSFEAPVEEGTTVRSVRKAENGYLVVTDQGIWTTANVVIATGPYHEPHLPPVAAETPPDITQATTSTYRRPSQLPPGGVLVVGAAASGVQLAFELRESGREVVLAVGSHTFLPRRYRGLDIYWWLEQLGALGAAGSRREGPPEHSLQLVGNDEGLSLGLQRLQSMGVRLAGRLIGLHDGSARFARDLESSCAAAYDRLCRVLDRVDAYVGDNGLESELDTPRRPSPVRPTSPVELFDLRREGFSTVLWATGYRRSYPWLHVPLLDRSGEIRHVDGVTPAPGIYAIGLPLLRSRRSTFIGGVGADAEVITRHLSHRRAFASRDAGARG